MTIRRTRVAISSVFVLGALASQACRAPTQAELDISTTAQCAELGSVALVVSGDPQTAEARVGQGFYAAQTTDCDVNRWIGSLVVTPGEDRAAVIVIAPPANAPISECLPPKYTGCIVARRAFSFIDHVSLKIPISLDVECRDVPCDAFSTCRKGSCYSSQTQCDDTGACAGSGELPDGGLSPDAAILVDGSPPHDGAAGDGSTPEAGTDSGADAADAADGGLDAGDSGDSGRTTKVIPAGVSCDVANNLSCEGTVCGAAQACCGPTSLQCGVSGDLACTAPAGADRYCCLDANCGNFGTKLVVGTPFCAGRSGSIPGTCSGVQVAPPAPAR